MEADLRIVNHEGWELKSVVYTTVHQFVFR
jgi:hypothetical protein